MSNIPPGPMKNLTDLFADMKVDDLSKLEDVYTSDIRFQDPFHTFTALEDLREYFRKQYVGVISCTFDYSKSLVDDNEGMVVWLMKLRHRKLGGGKELLLEGISHLKFREGKVCYHRDFFDSNEFVFEHIPVLSQVIKFAKARL